MERSNIRRVVIHEPQGMNALALFDKVSSFHVDLIERRLNQDTLTPEQKIAVIDKIQKDLLGREKDGIIR